MWFYHVLLKYHLSTTTKVFTHFEVILHSEYQTNKAAINRVETLIDIYGLVILEISKIWECHSLISTRLLMKIVN